MNIKGDDMGKIVVLKQLNVLLIGFGNFGQFIAKHLSIYMSKMCVSNLTDCSAEAHEINCNYFPLEALYEADQFDCDVIIFAVSIISFREVLRKVKPSVLKGKLIVDVLSVKLHARDTMLSVLPPESDILCTHPMFGPQSGKFGWKELPFMFDKVRITNDARCAAFLSVWVAEGCKMIEMSCKQHDEYAANSQFITHLTGRVLAELELTATPIDTKGFGHLLGIIDSTTNNSVDLFHGLFVYNPMASGLLDRLRSALDKVERQLDDARDANGTD